MKRLVALALFLIAIGAFAAPGRGTAQEKLRLLLDWKAQAEDGGYYQALATGIYRKHGLDVTILEGGPGVNSPQLIASGAVELAQASGSMTALNLLRVGAPVRAIMAPFQTDLEILMTHQRDDVKTLADMKGKPVMISDAAVNTYWAWLKSVYGFSDSQIRKFNNNYAPFLVSPSAIVQGFITNSPLVVEQKGVKPKIFLLSDYGYSSYGDITLAQQKLIDEKPQIVQAFVDATIEGWDSFIHGDPSPAMALIKAKNPDMPDDINAYIVTQLKARNIADGGDAKTLGIGAMTNERWRATFQEMVRAGIYSANMKFTDAYTLQFVDKRHGLSGP